MRYCVTGGAGHIGAALCARLLQAGHEVTALDNLSGGKRARLDGLGCELAVADVRDEDAVTRTVRGCGSVIHLAAVQGTANFYAMPSEVLSVAAEGTASVLRACTKAGVPEVVLASSAEAHQSAVLPTPEDTPLTVPDVLNPRFSYGGGKITAELMMAAAFHDGRIGRAVIIRPHNVIGPDMSPGHIVPDLCARVARLNREHPHGPLPVTVQGTGRETRCYTWIGDLLDQFLLIMEHAGKLAACHAGSRDEITSAQVARLAGAAWDREVTVVPSPLAAGSPPRRQPDLAFLDSLGYTPVMTSAEAISETAAWYRQALT